MNNRKQLITFILIYLMTIIILNIYLEKNKDYFLNLEIKQIILPYLRWYETQNGGE